ncbi:hypothetical protein [Poseidonibacter ostreae]|uniref:OmpH family outer membrane protein n=1 Tax=Poseidonibacter ostreae TaxID=2654171 RepID=A0A6L4WW39_9BACT|nr:hypothetical protein [Poseidonibacter ostreae]KAB7891282.1 hypothetical protein GBG19_00165 [Poseidonibacter ostreae]
MKNKKFILFFLLIGMFANSATISQMIGESTTLIDVEDLGIEPYVETPSTSSCACSAKINSTLQDLKKEVKDYTDESIESFTKMREQIKETKHEVANRTNNIEDDKYYNMLNNGSNAIKGNISSTNIAKYKLLGYNNVVLFSSDGLIAKKEQLGNIYSAINSLADLEISLKLSLKEKGLNK